MEIEHPSDIDLNDPTRYPFEFPFDDSVELSEEDLESHPSLLAPLRSTHAVTYTPEEQAQIKEEMARLNAALEEVRLHMCSPPFALTTKPPFLSFMYFLSQIRLCLS